MKRNILNTAIVAVVMGTASPASASHTATYEGIPVYNTVMFSDATKTTAIGTIWFQYCTYDYVTDTDGAQYRLQGTYTIHQTATMIGYCMDETFGPVH
jgi:hypothetical protein